MYVSPSRVIRHGVLTVVVQDVVDAMHVPGAHATFRTVRVPLTDEQADALRLYKHESFASVIIDYDVVDDHD